MAVNKDSVLIQEIPKKCKLQSGKRQTPSFFKKIPKTETWVVASTVCVCTQVFY